MTFNPGQPPAQQTPSSALSDERQIALIIYILYLVPAGITHIIGLVLAYVNRDSAPDWLKSHYTLQIRTFWIGLIYFVLAGVCCLLLIGFVLIPVVFIWFIVRCAIGTSRLMRNEAYPTPQSWMI